MKYMLMTFGDKSDWDRLGIADEPATWSKEKVAEHFRSMEALVGELQDAGEFVTGFGLTEPSTASTIEVRDGRPVASDGPYAEAKEVLAGFFVIETETHDRAVEIAGRFSGLVEDRVELRPVDEDAGQEF